MKWHFDKFFSRDYWKFGFVFELPPQPPEFPNFRPHSPVIELYFGKLYLFWWFG